ncbi:MAG: YitT family protein [Dysgonamonadaceae bacterium]|jgi:uncharacterized membrane-anchored protein YitT (DUF2179 family)|nr:YitT family protein [Dysgonamonadaceae bacterium]
MKIDKALFWVEAKDYSFIVLGLLFYSIGFVGFILPYEITPGGVAGISALIFYSSKIPVGISYFVINIGILALSIKVFGLKFSIRTIFGVVALTFLLSIFQHLITKPFVHDQPFMSCILGGVLCGIGIGIVINARGSTGGTDVLALIINKYKDITVGKGLMICDLLIISSSYFLFHSIEKIAFSVVLLGISSYTVDMVLNGARQSVQFLIFSDRFDEIADAINQQLHRGCTILDGVGWYSKKEVKVVVVIAKKIESVTIFRLIKNIDPNAFISQSSVIGVYGEGFDKIKAK